MAGLADATGLARRLQPLVRLLYPERVEEVTGRLLGLAEEYADRLAVWPTERLSERSTVLITYGDAIRRPGETPLHTLDEVMTQVVGDVVTGVHLLPMYPWTSDDGFAVVDYRRINPELGTWADVELLCHDRAVMFDFVANHLSSGSDWFREFLAGDPGRRDYFVVRDPAFDTSSVVRPRTSPLFHDYPRADGSTVAVWTTFGADQVDLDVSNPEVLVELTHVLLDYLAHGAAAVRLDAVGFLWKESGTSCLHLPQTHAVIKLWRALVDHLRPGVQIVTETNVPHVENISYYGDGQDEAHQVYQFALPPLVLHSFVSGHATELTRWGQGVAPVSRSATWFNFLASHDGVGLRATEGILDDEHRQALVDRVLAHGGRVSMASRPDGSQTVYELNLTYLDALCTPEEATDPQRVAAKALAAHAILLAFVGVPAIYYHSLFGSRPDVAGMEASGISRRINREVLDADRLLDELAHDTRRRLVFGGLQHLLDVRRRHRAFDPYGAQVVEEHDARVLVVRRAPDTPDELVCVTNVSGDVVGLDGLSGEDVLTGGRLDPVELGPYGYAWVRPASR